MKSQKALGWDPPVSETSPGGNFAVGMGTSPDLFLQQNLGNQDYLKRGASAGRLGAITNFYGFEDPGISRRCFQGEAQRS